MRGERDNGDEAGTRLGPHVWLFALAMVVLVVWSASVVRTMHLVRLEWRRNLDVLGETLQIESDLEKLSGADADLPASAIRTISQRVLALARDADEAATPDGSPTARTRRLVGKASALLAQSDSFALAPSALKEQLRSLLPSVSELANELRREDDRISARMEGASTALYSLGASTLCLAVLNLAFLLAWQRRRARAIHDIAQRRAAEAARQRTDASFRSLIEASPDAILLSQDGLISYVNPKAVEELGFAEAADLVGRREQSIVGDLPTPPVGATSTPPLDAPPPPREIRLRGNHGRAIDAELLRLIVTFDGKPTTMTVARNVTERKRMQALLYAAERMASVGTLAAGVGHEINNPLAFVLSNLQFLRGRTAHPASDHDDLEFREVLDETIEGAERIRRIVQDLRLFSRSDVESVGPVDLERVVETAVNMASIEIRHRAQLVVAVAGAPPVRGNEARLGQVVLNLLINAAQAIPEGAVPRNEIRIEASALGFDRVSIEVSDTGCGIPPEIKDKIFDPFFTTKPVGVGTGLGLFLCHGIVTALGGSISVESEMGRGTRFRVVLPAASPDDQTRRVDLLPPTPTPTVTAHRFRLLVVDDEALVGRSLARLLGQDYDVTLETSARAALARIEAGERFELVLSDLLMPDMTGMELYRELGRIDRTWQERIVFMTGGVFTPAAREFLARVDSPRLFKPIEHDKLRALLRERIGGATASAPQGSETRSSTEMPT